MIQISNREATIKNNVVARMTGKYRFFSLTNKKEKENKKSKKRR
jgi:hypothetical protein